MGRSRIGYDTTFDGQFTFDRPLDADTYTLLKGLAVTRRVKRKVDPKYGEEGEFYIDGEGYDKDVPNDPTVIDDNTPPGKQPGLWLGWTPTEDRKHLEWDGVEKFYEYVEWLEYLISKILKPRGYILNGNVKYWGEDDDDEGIIEVKNNKVSLGCLW